MPILQREPDVYPENLLEQDDLGKDNDLHWWVIYTRSQREKDFMRRLRVMEIPHYTPIVPRHHRSPSGKLRTSYIPLFSNYVFLYGDECDASHAMETNCISRRMCIVEGSSLTEDLRRIQSLIQQELPITLEARLTAGTRVRVRSGPLKGMVGTILERRGQLRLLVSVDFIQQGASVLLEDFDVESIF